MFPPPNKQETHGLTGGRGDGTDLMGGWVGGGLEKKKKKVASRWLEKKTAPIISWQQAGREAPGVAGSGVAQQ